MLALTAGCSNAAARPEASPVPVRTVPANGQQVALRCVGGPGGGGAAAGDASPSPVTTPTVVLLGGLGSSAVQSWSGIFPADERDVPAGMPRTCELDRPGVGDSPDRVGEVNSPVMNAQETLAALASAGEPGPYVFVGWSYGGLVALLAAQEAADGTPDELAGLVLVDPTLPDEYRTIDTSGWEEGGIDLDMAAGERAAGTVHLGDAPVLVVIAARNEANVTNWGHVVAGQESTARLSSDFLVLSDPNSDHDVMADDPAAVRSAIDAVVQAAAPDATMPNCPVPPPGLGPPIRCLTSD